MSSLRAIAMLLAFSPALAAASTAFTPVVEAGGRATDNAGDRPVQMGPRSAVTANGAAGGRLVFSQPIWSLRLEGLGEYEQYLSAPVRNTGASGAADARWRPDERTYVRSITRGSHTPDRWDPRVPYRLAISAAPGEDLPPFVRVTTTRWSERLMFEQRASEILRMRLSGGVSDTKYDDRRLAGPAGGRFDARLLQGRTVWELGAESLMAARENVEVGLYADGARADYEVTTDAYTGSAGAVMEWTVVERLSFRARTGPDYTTVPGSNLPDRWGYTAEAALVRRWTLAELELSGREGVFLADATTPAARRTDGRFTVRAQPFERLSFEVFAGAGMERSTYERFHATGTARSATAGTSLGWRMTQYLTARAGYQYAAVETTGRSALPYHSNTVFVGLSFTGWSFGQPAPEANP